MRATVDHKIAVDHKTAEKTSAVERYLLGEFSPEEREAFEGHFLECAVCAEQVRTGSIFVENARAVMLEDSAEETFRERAANPGRAFGWVQRDWFGWMKPAVLIPSFAALVMGTVVSYQNLVTLPALLQPQILSTTTIAPPARDAGSDVTVDRHRPMFNLNFPVDSPRVYPSYRCTFQKQGGPPVEELESGLRDSSSSFTLGVLLPVSKFPDGTYTLTIRPSSDLSVLIQRYTFTVRSGGTN